MPVLKGSDGRDYPFPDDATPAEIATAFNKFGVRPVVPGAPPAGPRPSPTPIPGSSIAVPPNQVSEVISNKESLARLAEIGVNVGSIIATDGASMAKTLGGRLGRAAIVGAGAATAGEAARQMLGLPRDENFPATMVLHAGLGLAGQGVGEVTKALPIAYRWTRNAASGGEYAKQLSMQEADSAATKQLFDTAQKYGFPTSVGRLTRSTALRRMEMLGERASLAGVGDSDRMLAEQATNVIRRSMADFFPGSPSNRTLGNAVQGVFDNTDKYVKQSYGEMMDLIDLKTGGKAIVDPAAAIAQEVAKATDSIDALKAKGVGAVLPNSSKRNALINEIVQGGRTGADGEIVPFQPLTMRQASEYLSNVKEGIRGITGREAQALQENRDALPILRAYERGLTSAMSSAAKAAGPDIEGIMKAGKDWYANWKVPIQKGVIGEMIRAKPEELAGMIPVDDVTSMRQVKDAIFYKNPGVKGPLWDSFRKSWLAEKLKGPIEEATSVTGQLGAPTSADESFKFTKRLLALDDMTKTTGKDMMKEFFSDAGGTALRQNLREVSDYVRRNNEKDPAFGMHLYMTLGAATSAVLGVNAYRNGPADTAMKIGETTLAAAAMVAILRNKTATRLLIKGMDDFPMGKAVVDRLSPSAVANVSRALLIAQQDTPSQKAAEAEPESPVVPLPTPTPARK